MFGIRRGFFVRGGFVVLVRGLVVLVRGLVVRGARVVRCFVVRAVLGRVVRVVLTVVRVVLTVVLVVPTVALVGVGPLGGAHEPMLTRCVPDRSGFSEHFTPEHFRDVTFTSSRVNFEPDHSHENFRSTKFASFVAQMLL